VATTFFFLLAHSYFHKARTALRKTLLVLGCIAGTLLVCLSRLYLGAHWALDILGGIAVGLLSVSFTILVFNVFIGDGRGWIKRPDLR
jgi:membrane-associated phospholipid phosphatase